jgi:carboxymethylenebutenolidase
MTSTRQESITAPDGGTFSGHLTLPDSGNGPGILLLQEIFGVNDFLTGKASDLASLGYVVLCPDVFWRVEPGLALPHDEAALQQAFGIVGRYNAEVTDEQKVGDLVAALDHLRALDEVTGTVAVMGYCLGGWLAYRVASGGEPDACVSYYGSGIEHFLGEADRVTCPILFHYGAADPYIPTEGIEQVAAVFGVRDDGRVEVQAGAGHAFENLLAPSFGNAEAAAHSWPITVAWLQRYLGRTAA